MSQVAWILTTLLPGLALGSSLGLLTAVPSEIDSKAIGTYLQHYRKCPVVAEFNLIMTKQTAQLLDLAETDVKLVVADESDFELSRFSIAQASEADNFLVAGIGSLMSCTDLQQMLELQSRHAFPDSKHIVLTKTFVTQIEPVRQSPFRKLVWCLRTPTSTMQERCLGCFCAPGTCWICFGCP